MLIYLFTNLFSSSKETTQETLSFSFSIHASSPAPPPHGADLPPPPPHGADIPSSSTSRRAPPSRAPQSRPPSSAPAPPPHAAVFPAPPPHAAVLHHKEMGEKQQWSNDHLKCLLETCIEEIHTVGRKGLSLHKDSWNKLGKVLKEKFGLDLTQKQMKNAYDNLKAKYVGWVYLKNKTGNIYNPQTNTFSLTNEEWEEFKKVCSFI
ncbi:putative Myb/SANT-like domain-containing protein [Helianthus annuus]|nr:putative Myb/SANT-like domain-containing protein [Helianthus annuus]